MGKDLRVSAARKTDRKSHAFELQGRPSGGPFLPRSRVSGVWPLFTVYLKDIGVGRVTSYRSDPSAAPASSPLVGHIYTSDCRPEPEKETKRREATGERILEVKGKTFGMEEFPKLGHVVGW